MIVPFEMKTPKLLKSWRDSFQMESITSEHDTIPEIVKIHFFFSVLSVALQKNAEKAMNSKSE
jgi:hypothetical protein